MRSHFLTLFLLLAAAMATAHPMPASVVKLSVMETSIKGEAKMPLPELESAVNRYGLAINSPFYQQYFNQHIRAETNSRVWKTNIISIAVNSAHDAMVGNYKQVIVSFELIPQNTGDLRTFTFNYDVIIHQVVTHQAMVILQQDWYNGIHEDTGAQVVGIIKLDIVSGKVYPLQIRLQQGSWFKGFVSILQLGMRHIKEGTDHLLFLIVLLLPSMLLPQNKKWGPFGGVAYSLKNILKIVTAFTIGHSITLLCGATGLLRVPGQPIEVLIAFSIFISAIHAMRPLFPGREIYIAGGFGLIHGMAFASVLQGLDLNMHTLALSILGFNIGIELMQLFVIAIILPWLILLSKTPFYTWFRLSAAILAAIAALGWVVERISGNANLVTSTFYTITPYSLRLIVLLAIASCLLNIKIKKTEST